MDGEGGHGVAREMAEAIVAESRRMKTNDVFSLECREGPGGVKIARVKITGGSGIAVRVGGEETRFAMEQLDAAVDAFLLTCRKMRLDENKRRRGPPGDLRDRCNYGPIWILYGREGTGVGEPLVEDAANAQASVKRETVFATLETVDMASPFSNGQYFRVVDRIVSLLRFPPTWTFDQTAHDRAIMMEEVD